MLRFFVVVVGLGLAYCQDLPRTVPNSYVEGNEYVYDYESQILTGVPDVAKIYSGLKLQSRVQLQFVSKYRLKIQLSSPRLYQINNLIDQVDPSKQMLPSSILSELLDEDAEKMKTEILKPVIISYDRGHVDDLMTEGDDPDWSVNMKRAVLSLLELNFNERQSLSKDVDIHSADQTWLYKVVEPSVAGECETTYKITSDRSQDSVPSLKVQKARNYEKCIDAVINIQDIFSARPCDSCEPQQKQEHLSAQSSVKYMLLGSIDQYVIANAVAESQYDVAPYSAEAGRIATISSQSMTLIDAHPLSIQIRELNAPVKQDRPLKMKGTEAQLLSPRTPRLAMEDRIEVLKMITKVLQGLENLLTTRVEKETGDLVHELKRQLEKLDRVAIEKLLDSVASPGKLPKARKVLLDVLPSVGSYSAVDVLLDRIEKEEISAKQAAVALIKLSFLPLPDAFIVKRLMDCLDKKDIKDSITDSILRRSAWLALGSLGRKMISASEQFIKDLEGKASMIDQLRVVSNDRQERRHLKQRSEEVMNQLKQTKELYSKAKADVFEMIEKLSQRSDKESKHLAMMVFSNLGSEESADSLADMLKDPTLSEQSKMDMVSALTYIAARTNSAKTESILLPLYLDRKQPVTVRIMAIASLLMSSRSSITNQILIKSLEDEENDNVVSFVHSALKDLSRISSSCDDLKELAKNSSLAKRFARISSPATSVSPKSSLMAKSASDDDLKMGHTYMQTFIYSPSERSPQFAQASYKASALGKSADILQLTYSGHGLDFVLDGLLEDSVGTSLESVLNGVLHPRLRRSGATSAEWSIQEVKDKIGVKPRESPQLEGHIGIRLLGQEIAYIDTKSLLAEEPTGLGERKSVLSSFKEKLSFIDNLKSLLKSQQSIATCLVEASVPSEAGLPLKVYIDAHTSVKVDGDIQSHTDGSSSKKSLMGKTDAELEIRPSALLELSARVEADMRHIGSGVHVKAAVHSDIPLSTSVKLDPMKSKLLVKVRDEQPINIAKLESHLHTEIRRFPSSSDRYPAASQQKEIKVIDDADVRMYSYQIGKDMLGRSVQVVGENSVRKDRSVAIPPLSGRQVLSVNYEPLSYAGLNIQIQHIPAETGSRLASEEESHEAEGSNPSGWFFGNWFSSDSKHEDQVSVERDSKSESSSADSSGRNSNTDSFINLEEMDASISYLKEKLRTETQILPTGVKSGMVLRVSDSDPRPQHQIQVSALYQRDQSDRNVAYTIEVQRSPMPDEMKPWKLVTDMQLSVPVRAVEPSYLFDSGYQNHVQEQIRLSVSENGQQIDSLTDLGSKIISNLTRQAEKSQKPDALEDIIEDIIDHVQDMSQDPSLKPIKLAVQRQRKVKANADALSKQASDTERIVHQVKQLMKAVEQSAAIKKEVISQLMQIPSGSQQPEASVQILYIVQSQEETQQALQKMARRLQPMVSLGVSKSIAVRLSGEMSQLEDLKNKLRQHATDKQSTEAQRVRIEVSPEQRGLYAKLLDVEQRLISMSELSSEVALSSASAVIKSSSEQIKALVADIIKASDSAKEGIDSALLADGRVDRMLRVKIFEIVLFQKLAAAEKEREIMSIDRTAQADDKIDILSTQDDFAENRKKVASQQRAALRKKAKELTDRLALTISIGQKDKASPSSTSDEKIKLDELTGVQIRVLQVREALTPEDSATDGAQVQSLTGKAQSSLQSVQKAIKLIQDASAKAKDIAEKELGDIKAGKKLVASPVLIQSMKMQAKLAEVLDEIRDTVNAQIVSKAAEADKAKLQSYQALKTAAQKLYWTMIENLQSLSVILSVTQSFSPSALEALQACMDVVTAESRSAVEEKIHKVEAEQAKIKSIQREFETAAKEQSSVSQSSSSVDQKTKLYDMISKLQMSQIKLDSVHQAIQKRVAAARQACSRASNKSGQRRDAGSQSVGAGSQSRDAGSQPRVAGSQPRDAGSQSRDAASQSGDVARQSSGAASQSRDAGIQSIEARSQPVDAASQPEDAASQSRDAGSQSIDAASQPTDAASQSRDTGTQSRDSGSQSRDAGSQSRSAGSHLSSTDKSVSVIVSAGPASLSGTVRSAEAQVEEVLGLIQALQEKQENQLSLVGSVEKILIGSSKYDMSLLKSLQRVQQLKDKVQRQQQETTVMEKQVQEAAATNAAAAAAGTVRISSKAQATKSAVEALKDVNKEVSGLVRVSYGEEDKEKKRITVRLIARKSLEQLLWEQDQANPGKHDPAVHTYLADRREPLDPAARQYQALKDKLNNYKHLHLLVAYEDTLPKAVQEIMWKAREYAKLKLADKVELHMPDNSNIQNRVVIKVEVGQDDKWTNVEIRSPSETSRFRNLATPEIVQRLRLTDGFSQSAVSLLSSRNQPATCEVMAARVKTVTGQIMEVDLNSAPCDSVLAVDCSSQSSLAVTIRSHPQEPRQKIVKIMLKDSKVEISTGASGEDISAVQVSVDDKSVRIPARGQPAQVSDNDKPRVILQRGGDNYVTVKIPHIGVSVSIHADGSHVSMKIPQNLAMKLCGICGSLSASSVSHDPQGLPIVDPQALASTYLVPDSQCDVTAIQRQTGAEHQRQEASQVSPAEETKVKDKVLDGIQKTCFSIIPIPKCPPDSSPLGTEIKHVDYKCIRSSSHAAQVYREAAKSRVVTEVRNMSADFTEAVAVPKQCVKQ